MNQTPTSQISVFVQFLATAGLLLLGLAGSLFAEEPATINPFGKSSTPVRDDAVPGEVKLSDGSVHAGQIYLTRDKQFQIYDEKLQRQREVPIRAVKQIECLVKREWMEKEWKFKETTSDEKMYTGRSYPAREYRHKITLNSGRTISGPMSAIVYVQEPKPKDGGDAPEAQRFMLHKRDKGKIDTDLKSLVYVQQIKLGKETDKKESRKEK